MKTVTLQDFLTPTEITQCVAMWDESRKNYAQRVCKAVVAVNMDRINKALGQQNDAMYLSYAIELVMIRMQAYREISCKPR